MNNPRYSHRAVIVTHVGACQSGTWHILHYPHYAAVSIKDFTSWYVQLDKCQLKSRIFPASWVCIDKLDARNEIHLKDLSEKISIKFVSWSCDIYVKINNLTFVFNKHTNKLNILANHSFNWGFLAAHYFFTQQGQILGNKFT